MPVTLTLDEVEPLLRSALDEDLGKAGDITSNAIIPESARASAVMRARKPGVLSGVEGAAHVFRMLDPKAKISISAKDGAALKAGQDILSVDGDARAVLAAERTALNYIGHLSGIATETRKMVDLVKGTKARVCCTRKTNPGLRLAEKYAVRMGGGDNHRTGLFDAILIKDNHIAVAGGIRPAVEKALAARKPGIRLEAEVDSISQLKEIIDLPVDAVLLDNMKPDDMRACVQLVNGKFELEASGGITAANIRGIAESGVDIISLGWLTHSAPALDIGLDIDI
jgi:nicotinate-nucleotide pyrophosphorylase (carboxylating)